MPEPGLTDRQPTRRPQVGGGLAARTGGASPSKPRIRVRSSHWPHRRARISPRRGSLVFPVDGRVGLGRVDRRMRIRGRSDINHVADPKLATPRHIGEFPTGTQERSRPPTELLIRPHGVAVILHRHNQRPGRLPRPVSLYTAQLSDARTCPPPFKFPARAGGWGPAVAAGRSSVRQHRAARPNWVIRGVAPARADGIQGRIDLALLVQATSERADQDRGGNVYLRAACFASPRIPAGGS